ncbi:MAG: hypothetical protein E4G96_09365 [Chrysiogenales bacterium]|nr:MAG: hypothetical protein E4G96_09365 [Chrysiogenales bacterium]
MFVMLPIKLDTRPMNGMALRIQLRPLHAALLALLFLLRCASGTDDRANSLLLGDVYHDFAIVENGIDAAGEYDFKMYGPEDYDNIGNVNLTYTLDLGANVKDVYFLFTNIHTSTDTSYPAVSVPALGINQGISLGIAQETEPVKAAMPDPGRSGIRGKPEASEFNRNPFPFISRINPVSLLLGIITPPEPRYDGPGNTQSFKINSLTSVDATCRLVRNANTDHGVKTVNIWVANDCWIDGGTKSPKVTPDMLAEVADKFLAEGDDNDIYDWITGIFDEEWGGDVPDFAAGLVIPPDDEITILLFDIDNDNSTSGGILGYFWAKDNFKKSAVPYSNERVMFYIDALLLARADDATWSINDRWPAEIVSALAHELQHMIHFYQKNILRAGGAGTETWIDEICSLAAEDLVSVRMAANGPRGALHTSRECVADSKDQAYPAISMGRLPVFNYYNEYSVTRWYGGANVLVSYALNYALGSYLARNFGGAAFFRDVVHNPYTDLGAIEYALDRNGSADGFGAILRKWAIAAMLSDRTDTGADFLYNRAGDWFRSIIDPIEYRVGAIDLYKYTYAVNGHTGPYIYTHMPAMPMQPASTIYYLAAENLAGARTWSVKMKRNVRMTVLVK